MKKVYRNYLFLLLIICQCGWIIVGNNPAKTIEKSVLNEKEKNRDKDKGKKEKEDPKSNRRNKKSRRLSTSIAILNHRSEMVSDKAERYLPAIVAPPTYVVDMPKEEKEYYKFNEALKVFQPVENSIVQMGFDPVRFTVLANQDSVELGKEFEIKITAEYLDVSPRLIFQFDGSNEYSLKMLMPKGFVHTGGSYYDFFEGSVNPNNPKQEITIKGYFEGETDNMCFSLLRSFRGAGVNDSWIRKTNYCPSINKPVSIVDSTSIVNTTLDKSVQSCSQDLCIDTKEMISDCVVRFTGVVKNKFPSNVLRLYLVYHSCGTCNAEGGGNVIVELKKPFSVPILTGQYMAFEIDVPLSAIKDAASPTCNTNHFDLYSDIPNENHRSCNISQVQITFPKLTASRTYNSSTGDLNLSSSYISGDLVANPVFSWKNPSGLVISSDQNYTYSSPTTGYYQVSMTFSGCTLTDQTLFILTCSKPADPTINTSTNPQIPYGSSSIPITATCPSGTTAKWKNNNTGVTTVSNSIDATEANYTLKCEKTSSCYSSLSVTVSQEGCTKPTAPVVKITSSNVVTNNPQIPAGSTTINLTATCPSGTSIKWPNGSVASTYDAPEGPLEVKCIRTVGSGCENSTFVNVTQQPCTPLALVLTLTPASLMDPGDVSFSLSGCTGGTIKWTPALRADNTQYVSTTTTFKAECTKNGCVSEIEKTVTVQRGPCTVPAKPVITQKSPVALATGVSTVTLSTSTTCPGTLTWSNDKTGNSIIVGEGTYSVSCIIHDKCYSSPSDAVVVRECSPPAAPNLTASIKDFNNGGGTTRLYSSGCLGTVMWDHDLGYGYTKDVTVNTTTTYHAYCILNNCNGPESEIKISVDCSGATTPSISILSTGFSSTTLQATNCSGTVVWNNDPNQTGATRTFSDGGNYFATCKLGTCESSRSNTIYLGGGCSEYEIWAYANATANPGSVSVGDNLVLMAGVTGRPSSDYHFEWHYNNNATKISGSETPVFTIPSANTSNNGSYTVHVRRLGSDVTCTKSFNVEIAPCNLHAGASWVKQNDGSGNPRLYFSIWADKDMTGATYNWTLPNGTTNTSANFDVPATAAYKGNYTLNITLRTCTITSVLNNVQYDAIPDFSGSVDYVWCDVVKGRAEDKANPGKEVNVKLMVNGTAVIYQKTINNRFEIAVPTTYRNGSGSTVNVRLNEGSNETALGVDKTITCCLLEFPSNNPITTSCNTTTGKGKATISLVHGTGLITYRLSKKFYNEAQQVYYEPLGFWDEIPAMASSFDINNLDDGHYKLEIREGNTCTISAVFTIDCAPLVAGCKPPKITVTPSDTVREGVGIIPTIYAEFVGTSGLINTNPTPTPPNGTPPNNGFGKGLYLNGNAEFNLTAIDSKSTFTFEAWIQPENRVTTVGFIGGGEKHYYLIQSVYQTGVRFQLSAGKNGLTLIESLGSNRRVALSYESSIAGLTHLALVYDNNLPKLYINGTLVATAAKTFHQEFSIAPNEDNKVLAGRQIGFHSNLGFEGYIDEIRGWHVARSQIQIQEKMTVKKDLTLVQSGPVGAPYHDIDGYWVFDDGSGLTNLRHTTDVAKLENAVPYTISTFPTYQTPTLTWYEGTSPTSVGTGNKYVMPANKVRADGVTYTVKYTGEGGVPCEVSKTVVVKRAQQNTLSGCFFVSPNYETTRKVHFALDGGIPRLLNTRVSVGEDGIWRFEHDGNGIYRVILPYSEQLVTYGINGATDIQLAARATNQPNQLWKFKFIDSLSQNPTIKLQSVSGSGFITSSGVTTFLATAADAGPIASSQIFKLEKTTCPVAPKPCATDGKITIEKITAISAATTTYLEQNDDLLSSYVTKFRGNGKTVSTWGNNTTRISFSGSIPENDVRTDNFVVRLTGYFCAPGTGEFEFGLAGVDKSQLFISPSEEERTKERLVKNTVSVDWTTWANTTRAKYYMTQNRSYYIEASMLVKSTTVEHLKLGVQGPGITDGPSSTQGVLMQHFASSPRDKKPARIRDDSEACGKIPEGPLASDDLSFLMKGDTIFAGDFKVIVDAVTGANGTFSGTGTAKVKYMFDTPIKVRFDGVRVNDYYDLVSGEITTEYDKDWKNVVDVDTVIRDVIDGIKSFADGADKLCKFDPDKYSGKALTGMEKPLFEAGAKEIDATLADKYRNIYTLLQTQMAIIDANRNACRAIPPDQTACTAVNQAITAIKSPSGAIQTACNNAETERTNKLTAYNEIIEMALLKIEQESSASKSTILSSYNTALTNLLGGPLTQPDASQLAEFNGSKTIASSSLDAAEISAADKEKIRNYFEKELGINRVILSFNFAKMKRSEAKKLGEDIVLKDGSKLAKFIIDELSAYGATPTTANKQQLAHGAHPKGNVKEKLLAVIYDILSESVYND